MSETRSPAKPADPPGERKNGTPTYQGSRFPWWLTLFWVAFLIWGLAYASLHYLPDLRAWLSR
jgi:hypothetical protein